MVYGRIKIQYIQRGKDIKLNVFSYKSQLRYARMMLASIGSIFVAIIIIVCTCD